MTIPDVIEQKIFLIRGHKVMLDKHLAMRYGVQTKALNQSEALKEGTSFYGAGSGHVVDGAE